MARYRKIEIKLAETEVDVLRDYDNVRKSGDEYPADWMDMIHSIEGTVLKKVYAAAHKK